MTDFHFVGRRILFLKIAAFVLLGIGVMLLGTEINAFVQGPPTASLGVSDGRLSYTGLTRDEYWAREVADWKHDVIHSSLNAVLFLVAGMLFYAGSRKAPTREVLRLAKERGGLVSLSEITVALNIDPRLALSALQILQKVGVATQRWTDLQRNAWEFSDYFPARHESAGEMGRDTRKAGRDPLVGGPHFEEGVPTAPSPTPSLVAESQ